MRGQQRDRLTAHRLAPLLRADPEMHGQQRDRLNAYRLAPLLRADPEMRGQQRDRLTAHRLAPLLRADPEMHGQQRDRLNAYRLAPLLRADPEMHGQRREQLLDGVGLGQEGRVFDKTRLHAVGQTALGRIQHFQIRLSMDRFMRQFDAGGDFTFEINIGEKEINLRALVSRCAPSAAAAAPAGRAAAPR
jgi:hypothetical protein